MKNTTNSSHITHGFYRGIARLSRLQRVLGTCLLAMAFAFSLVALTGCNTTVPAQSQIAASSVVSPAQAPCSPARIAVFIDKTGSTSWTRTPDVAPDDLQPLEEILDHCGGELAVGLIRDSSNRGLLRLLISEPPVPPVAPDPHMNPFLLAEQQGAYEEKSRAYQEDLARRHREFQDRIRPFREQLKIILRQPANAPRTDIWGALLRSELFLNEPSDIWKKPPHKYAIFVTDGLDNVVRQKVVIRSGAKILVVNGSATLGDLASLNPLAFENTGSAIGYVVSLERRK